MQKESFANIVHITLVHTRNTYLKLHNFRRQLGKLRGILLGWTPGSGYHSLLLLLLLS